MGKSPTKEIEQRSCLVKRAPNTQQERWDPWKDRTSIQSCVSMLVQIVDKDEDADENIDADQTRTERPVKVEEIDIDFRVPGLSHAVVEEAENFRVQELVKKIESHPHREVLQADSQQSDVYNPFCNNSKVMIRELGNVELFELCETIPNVQCSSMSSLLESRNCLLHLRTVLGWKRIQKKVLQTKIGCSLYALRDQERALPWCSTQWNWRTERVPCSLECVEEMLQKSSNIFKGVHVRFLRDQVYRESQLSIGWTEQKCKEMGELAQEDHSYKLTSEEFRRYQGQ